MECTKPLRLDRDGVISYVPCGACPACLANRRAEWCIRLKAELFAADFGLFVTLTSDNEHIKIDDVIDSNTGEYLGQKTSPDKVLIQLFLKRLRKRLIPKGSNKSIRYFIISEYGDHTQRAHYHGLFFFKGLAKNKELYDAFTETWQQGFCSFGDISDGSIAYCTKYMMKKTDFPFGIKDTFTLCSRRPAIGSDEIIKQIKSYNIKADNFSQLHIYGNTARLPRLFRDKMTQQITSNMTEDDVLFFKAEREKVMQKRRQQSLQQWLRLHPDKDIRDYNAEKQKQFMQVRDELILSRTKKQNHF